MSSLFTFLLVIQAVVAAVMIGVILMQKSEGGGLGMGGGSPAGLLSARGAADFMTRATTVLATLFVGLSIILAAMASVGRGGSNIDTSLSKTAQQSSVPAGSLTGAAPATVPAQPAPATDDPLAAAAAATQEPATKGVPLEQ